MLIGARLRIRTWRIEHRRRCREHSGSHDVSVRPHAFPPFLRQYRTLLGSLIVSIVSTARQAHAREQDAQPFSSQFHAERGSAGTAAKTPGAASDKPVRFHPGTDQKVNRMFAASWD
jgi:hypothetical protein